MRVRRSAGARHRRSVVFAGALAAVGTVAILALLGMLGVLGSGALTLLPALLLAAALFAGRFPGERLIERWTRARPCLRRALAPLVARTRPVATTPRGGLLVAAALAGRAPPALAAG